MMKHDLAGGMSRCLQPKRDGERIGPREMPDPRKRKSVFAIELRCLAILSLDQCRSFVRVARSGWIDAVGDLIGLDFIKRKGGCKPRHCRFDRFALEPF